VKKKNLQRHAQTLRVAIELFGNEEKAKEWMSTNLPALGDRTPLELLDSSAGFQLVIDTLEQISYGAPA